jgi:predicted nucleic acid-binding protein
MRIFLDANVLFSASKEGSNVSRTVLALFKKAEILTSEIAHGEARRNLLLKREMWLATFDQLCTKIVIVPTVQLNLTVTLNHEDLLVLSAAISNRCNYFVTGDKNDFGHLYDTNVEGVEIVSLERLAQIFTTASC